MRIVFRQKGLSIVCIEIDVQVHHFDLFRERKIALRSTSRHRFGSDNRNLMLRMRCEPVHFLGQHPLHSAGVIEMGNAIEDSHTVTSFF